MLGVSRGAVRRHYHPLRSNGTKAPTGPGANSDVRNTTTGLGEQSNSSAYSHRTALPNRWRKKTSDIDASRNRKTEHKT